ncbi:hypothetical protein [Mesorhizobium sp.]|uniref:hypothetical protein n=1 Tax=Mesorhizobium sp. TaxID=1871066 RepID=UPI0025BD7A68|nr:hypothetical protein [Mesorhizobium sp.]
MSVKVSGRKYTESVRELCAGELGLEGAVSALLAVRARIEQEIRTLEEHILGFDKHSDPPVDDGARHWRFDGRQLRHGGGSSALCPLIGC